MSVRDDRAKARERIERTGVDLRGYGGRRLGFETEQEREARMLLEQRLLELAKRAVRKGDTRARP